VTIARVLKVSLVGPLADKDGAFAALQALGTVHLVAPPEAMRPGEGHSPAARDVVTALRYLKAVKEPRRQAPLQSDFDLGATVERVLQNRRLRRSVLERIDHTRHRIQELAPWGDFPIVGPETLNGRALWLYQLTLEQARVLERSTFCWFEAARDNRFVYVVIVAQEQPRPDQVGGKLVRHGPERLSALEQTLLLAELELEELDAERVSLTRWIDLVARGLARVEDEARLTEAAAHLYRAVDGIFLVQGWVAERDLSALTELAQNRRLVLLADRVHHGDRPPTLLENQGLGRVGQDLLGVYSTPGYHTWDPSAMVAFSFTTFFAMIVSDAGYGLTLWLLLAYFHRRLGATPARQRFRRLAHVLCAAAVAYGVFAGSYYGATPANDSALGALAAQWILFDVADYDAMMRLSVIVGVAHVLVALVMASVRGDGTAARVRPWGWVLALCGGLGHWLSAEIPGTANAWSVAVAAGLAVVVAAGGRTAPRDLRSALRRAGEGVLALSDVSKLFGDVMSYLRLFALGLAGSSLAFTFNDLASSVRSSVPGLGILLAILILIGGHTINLALAVVGATVHGLRLNFIEFLSWGIAAEGYPFRPFKKTEVFQ
jgi:V/A-type H+-transporting ATPase subunit I